MKKIYLLLLLLSLSAGKMHSQGLSSPRYNTANIDSRISEVYGDQLKTLILDLPERFDAVNDILFIRAKIVIEEYSPSETYQKLSEIPLFDKYNKNLKRDTVIDKDNFNYIKYRFRMYASHTVKYRIDGTNQVIVILPQSLKE